MAHRWKPNVTVAAVIEQDGRFLVVEEQTSEGLRLNSPAGHLDPGESPAEGCARETLEETAHRFTPDRPGRHLHGAPARRARRGHHLHALRLLPARWAPSSRAARWTTASCAPCG